MTIEQFARITKAVIAKDGFESYLPTALYLQRRHFAVLEGVPEAGDVESIAMAWAAKGRVGDEEFLVAFKTGPSAFKVVGVAREQWNSASLTRFARISPAANPQPQLLRKALVITVRKVGRAVGLVIASVGAWLIFAMGAIAPLTPSEGMPSAIDIAACVGIPLLLVGFVARKVRSPAPGSLQSRKSSLLEVSHSGSSPWSPACGKRAACPLQPMRNHVRPRSNEQE